MNRRQWVWLTAIVVLTLLVAASSPAVRAQEEAMAPDQPVAEPEASTGETAVEEILRQQEDLITGQMFSYNPEGRRDPFRSLYESLGPTQGGKRPQGVAGMLVAELDLTGVVNDPRGGDVVVVMGSDNKGYFLRAGDEVYDGTVIAIDTRLGTVTFRQPIDDPRSIKPYRDVVKRLVPLGDEESGDE